MQPALGAGGALELHQACSFRITGNSVGCSARVPLLELRLVLRRSVCMDASFCSLGLTCYRPSADVDGRCVDLCQTVADCQGTSRTCDRSAPITTLGGVPIHRRLDTSP
ncbi:MAG: hypothetical protein U0353_28895 [Sandaracinus sp.]